MPATTTKTAPLLDRADELATIDKHVRSAGEGAGSVLLVEGPAGIGKSELLGAARERAGEEGLAVLWARGGELERSFAFGIVRELFEARLTSADASERRMLLGGAAGLAAPAVGVEPQSRRSRSPAFALGDPAAVIQHGLYWLCANLAEEAPLLISVDDLHWSDPASARWLLYLARRIEGLPVLVVAAVRSGEPNREPELIAALSDEAATHVLRPEALSEAASAELIRERLGPEGDEEFRLACHRASGGNPFLLGELIEAIRRDEIPATAASTGAVAELAPETVSRSVVLRLARMPPGAEPFARAIAVLGSEAEPGHAASLAELDERSAATAADALAAASILAPDRPLRFAHPLLDTAVYDQIPRAERALAHGRAAGLLAERGARSEQVAAQLLRSQPAGEEWAVETLRAAAFDALARGVPEAAVSYLRRALVEPPTAALRTHLLTELGSAGRSAGDLSVFEGISEDPVAELVGDPSTFLDSALEVALWLFGSGRLDEGADVMERAIVAATEAGDNALALRIEMHRLSVAHITPADAMERLERYADSVEPGKPEERLWFGMRAWWQHFLGDPATESAELARRALAGGRLIDEQPDVPVADQAILVLLRADELDEAEASIEHALHDARRRGSAIGFAIAAGLRSQLALRRGDVHGAVDDVRTGLAMSREHHFAIVIPLATSWLVDVLIEQGELDEADKQLTASGLLGEIPDHYWFTPALFSRARLRLAQGRTGEALEDLRGLLPVIERAWPPTYPVAATLALASRVEEPDEARRLAESQLARAREWGTPHTVGVALRASSLVAGGERGIELLREAVETLAASPSRLEHARALSDLGAALRRANRRRQAREPLGQALDLAHRCGATAIEERTREELAATGAKPRRVRLTGLESLTASELRVARMAADGMENRDIAQALFVTVKTVEGHLSNAYRKLSIASRRELPAELTEPD